ncbi:MAG: DUF2723 domain-containing protein [Rhodothermales bacterium]|nr:DUF2723 domain-containing protein [Rhodothermales bacterium]MDG2016360.1 DUF2723 domain-containing protein [Rhodothermales bacterium]HAY37336.1 DUF2723 domain-containing protein [Bacteroidota bacterium]
MNWKQTEKLVSWLVFAYSLVLYFLTVAPATSFWDSGEFIAIANRLQVSHPPGAPFFMLIGRFFSMFVPSEYVALSVNLVSVFSSAVTVLLLHLIIVRLIREWQGHPSTWNPFDRIMALAGGVIGACTFAVTDSFWFNAVEAEVYALSMLFTAAVVYLILRWREEAALEDERLSGGQHRFGLATNRYLILIAYLFGLAIGVHLLNLLAIFFIALIVFYIEFENEEWNGKQLFWGLVGTGAVSSLSFLIVYPGLVQVLPGVLGDSPTPLFLTVTFFAAIGFGVWWSHKNGKQALNLVMLCLTVVMIGYSSYTLIFIRSASNPPIDENDPETVDAIVSYLKREQYGATPLLTGFTYDNAQGTIPSRSGQEKLFPRRYSPDPNHTRVYARYESDSEYFWQYQVGHMYMRYFLWNFVGRASDIQDAPAITGLSSLESDQYFYQTPSERASRNAYYGLPLLLGLIGAAFHFMRDWRRAFAVLVLFLITGIGIILYLNQTPMQPRERDYAYVASFFAFSIWVGIGATGLLRLMYDSVKDRLTGGALQAGLLGASAIIFAAVPLLMMLVNYDDHDRSGRYVAGDYAYNMLVGLEDNAVIFTNGDNDTFPLWYIQEVEGVRQDVRVANLSLLNTPWYVQQLKDQWSRDSAPLPISLADDDIENLEIMGWQPRQLEMPVDKEAILGTSEMDARIQHQDSSLIESPMKWTLEGRPYSKELNLLYGADQAALNILLTNAQQNWKRPIYFAVTVAPSGQLNLHDYFQLEGQAYRVVPIKHDDQLGRVVPGLTDAKLRQFRFTGLNDPDVYFDENIRRMTDNYRNIFSHTAETMAQQGLVEEGLDLMNWFMEQVPFETIPGDETSYAFMAQAYSILGDMETATQLWEQAEPLILHRLLIADATNDSNLMGRVARFVEVIRGSYLEVKNFEGYARFTNAIADLLGDPEMRTTVEETQAFYEVMQEQISRDSLSNQ